MLSQDMHLHCMTSGADFWAKVASNASALNMSAFNVIDHALPRLRSVLAPVTLPHTIRTSWHQLLNSEVQVWEQVWLKLFLLVKSGNKCDWSYSCLWNLDLWIIKAFLVGHCLWQRGQENPDELICLASTWFWTWEIFFELYPHSVHCQQPPSFLNMKLFTKMFRPSMVSA